MKKVITSILCISMLLSFAVDGFAQTSIAPSNTQAEIKSDNEEIVMTSEKLLEEEKSTSIKSNEYSSEEEYAKSYIASHYGFEIQVEEKIPMFGESGQIEFIMLGFTSQQREGYLVVNMKDYEVPEYSFWSGIPINCEGNIFYAGPFQYYLIENQNAVNVFSNDEVPFQLKRSKDAMSVLTEAEKDKVIQKEKLLAQTKTEFLAVPEVNTDKPIENNSIQPFYAPSLLPNYYYLPYIPGLHYVYYNDACGLNVMGTITSYYDGIGVVPVNNLYSYSGNTREERISDAMKKIALEMYGYLPVQGDGISMARQGTFLSRWANRNLSWVGGKGRYVMAMDYGYLWSK